METNSNIINDNNQPIVIHGVEKEGGGKKKPIHINLKLTKYSIVKQITVETLRWKPVLNDDWDITWSDCYISEDFIRKLFPYQRINHFPGSYLLCKKNFLASHLLKLQQMLPEDYDFFPKTWILPFNFNNLQDYAEENSYKKVFIAKPDASCQGRGIFLTKKVFKTLNERENYVVQEYIKDPFLIDGYKFDLRLYVLIKNVEPLKIFLYNDGLARFATEKFQKPRKKNFNNFFMHLTNYSINKKNPNFIQNHIENDEENGHKRSYLSVLRRLEKEAKNTKNLQKSIDELIIKTICSVQPYLAHIYKANRPKEQEQEVCFEILGFDILIDQNLKPLLLEVNHTPSFSTDSDLDYRIKYNLIKDTLKLVNIKRRQSKLKKKGEILEYEDKNMGNFRRIYPNNDEFIYEKFMSSAQDIWDLWSKGKKNDNNTSKTTRRGSGNETFIPKPLSNIVKRPFSAVMQVQKIKNSNNLKLVQPMLIPKEKENNTINQSFQNIAKQKRKLIRPKSAIGNHYKNEESKTSNNFIEPFETDEVVRPPNKNLKIVKEFLKPRNVGIIQEFNFNEIMLKNTEIQKKFKTSRSNNIYNNYNNFETSSNEFDDKRMQRNFAYKVTQFPNEMFLNNLTRQKMTMASVKQISSNYLNKNLKSLRDKSFF